MADEEPDARYRLGSRERRGLLAGWRGGQVLSVATGLALAVGAVRAVPGDGGIALALALTLAGVAGACWPVRGRTLDEWAPAVARHVAMAIAGAARWRDPAPLAGQLAGVEGLAAPAPARPVRGGRRGCLDGLAVEAVPVGAGGGAAGVVHDRELRTWTAVLSVGGNGFALLGTGERRERVAAWSRLLAALARDGSAVHRLQWLERCVPDAGDALRRHYAEAAPPPAVGDDRAAGARRSYEELLAGAMRHGVRHELYVAVTVREPRGRRDRGAAAGRLLEEAASLERALRQAGALVDGVLPPASLRSLLAAPFAPAGAAAHAASPPPAPAGGSPWPAAYAVEWDRFRAGATLHASYWIAEWPRSEVGDDFLVPLVTSAAARRTLSVTLAPVAPLRASRDAEHARTSGVADAEIRRRHGFAVTARARRDHDAVLQREAELAAGHASYRFSGYLTVTAGDHDELERSCLAVERLAAGCQLELRRLHGAQDVGFLATLPIGRGLA